jgi:hypothetical protein
MAPVAAAYHTSVEYLDASVGRVLAALKQSGHDDDTLVVYLGDHGYLLGQHGRFEKHCSYEEAVRVPLLSQWRPVRAWFGSRFSPCGKCRSVQLSYGRVVLLYRLILPDALQTATSFGRVGSGGLSRSCTAAF